MMNIFFWRDNKKIDAFAKLAAEELYSHVLPDDAKLYFFGGARKEAVKKSKAARTHERLVGLISQVRQFREGNGLGIYGKARLQLSFTSRLQELGYDAAVVGKIGEIILVGFPK